MKNIYTILLFLGAALSCRLTHSNNIPFYYKAFLTETVAAVSISAISPTSGIEGDTVTVSGKNFSTDCTLTFGGSTNAVITSRTGESLSAAVPVNAKSGNIKVSCSSSSAASTGSFTVYRYFVYIPVGANLEIYKFNPNTGSITAVSGSPFSSNIGNAVFGDPSGKFIYSSVFASSNNIRSYIINSSSGTAAAATAPVVSANNNPFYLDFHPSGKFLYAANYTSLDISVFAIDQTTGNLSKIADTTASCSGCANLSQLRVSPNGKFLIVNGNGANRISSHTIDQTAGTISFNQTLSPTGFFDGIVIDPNSAFVYAVSTSPFNHISGFSINATSGSLTALSGSPFAGTSGNMRAAMHPSGKFLYTVNTAGALLAKHDISSNGTLSVPSQRSCRRHRFHKNSSIRLKDCPGNLRWNYVGVPTKLGPLRIVGVPTKPGPLRIAGALQSPSLRES